MEKLDFSALERLNMPPINIEAKDLESVEGQPLLTKDEIEEAKETAIQEVAGLDEFSGEENTEDSEDSAEDSQKESAEAEASEFADEDSEGTEGSGGSEEPSVIQAVAEWAKAKGVFDYEDDQFEDSEDWLENKLVEKSKAYADEWKDSLPPVIKEVINNYEEGVPLDELIYSKSREIEYNSVDEDKLGDSEALQKKLVADWLFTQDFSEEEIDAKLKKYEDALILEDEAKTALKKLRAYESKYQEQLKYDTERKKQAAQENYNQMLKQIESDIMASEEIIPGIQLSKEEKKKVYDAYTKQDSSKKTQLMKALENDPQAWYKITQFMVLMNGNLKDVEKKLNTKATKKVKETVNTYKETPGLNKLTSPSSLKAMKKAIEKVKKQSSF
jgi:hypothetical protein